MKGIFFEQHEKHWSLWNKANRPFNTVIIVLEADPVCLLEREKELKQGKNEYTTSFFFLKRYRYRQLSAFYGNVHLIDTTKLSKEEVAKVVKDIYENKTKEYIVPCVDEYTQEMFDALPKVIEGESKIIRTFNKRFQIIQYKASVHSHKQQRSGIVEGTDKERMKMTKSIIDIFSRYEIKHSYFFIGENFILNESLNPEKDLPPVEIIVKRCFVGSDKVRYYKMEELKNRFGQPVIKKEKQNEYIEKIVDNSGRLSMLCQNILNLSKLENQQMITDKKTYRLDEQIRKAVLALEPLWSKKNIEFDINLPKQSYNNNEALVYHVWHNLIANAIKFTDENGLISIKMTSGDNSVIVSVADNGCGMTEDVQKHIFEKFYQGDTTRKAEGNGLGLALVKRIVDLCSGTVKVQSSPGNGATFIVELPL